MTRYRYHEDGTQPTKDQIFVFGSNTAGRHGAGAALYAAKHCGAVHGDGYGRTGMSYAIPTKGKYLQVLPLDTIRENVEYFKTYAAARKEHEFFITRIGCGLAGYSDPHIAPMFFDSPENCNFPEEWKNYLEIK